jgi:Gram-negative porin
MVRSVAARGKLALAFWMLFAFCRLAHCEGSVEVDGTIDLCSARETRNTAGPVNKVTSGVESGSRLGFKGREDLGGRQPNRNSRCAGCGGSLSCVGGPLQIRSAYFGRNALTPGVDPASSTVLATNVTYGSGNRAVDFGARPLF